MKKQHKYLAIGGLLVLAFLFYWFQVRPSNIRSDCHEQATKAAIQKNNKDYNKTGTTYDIDVYNNYFKLCLNKYGQ